MIHAECPSDVPPALKKKWTTEKPKASAAFAAHQTYEFSAYAAPGVKILLERIFNKKCAYCECKYRIAVPADIEHYRPKAKVTLDGKKSIPGYYWLAGELSNLVPSCRFCNSENYHVIAGKGTTPIKVGKANWFPLWDEKTRATKEGDEAKEYPLLLHPYRDDPDQYLEFRADGLVFSVAKLKGKNKSRAEVSIFHYGLNRTDLVEERRDWAKRVQGAINHVLRSYGDWKSARTVAKYRKRVVDDWKDLSEFVGVDRPYQALTKRLFANGISRSVREAIEAIVR